MPAEQSGSAGLACWVGRESAEELLGRADKALYDAKLSGRDRTVVA
jgi:PleD family two-component response regulator